MTSKTKGNFNSGNKQVYKYNIVKKPSETIEPLSLLNSIKMNADSLNGRIEEYYHLIDAGIIPVYRGHILNTEDLIIRKHVLNLMCNFKTSWLDHTAMFEELPEVLLKLKEFNSLWS